MSMSNTSFNSLMNDGNSNIVLGTLGELDIYSNFIKDCENLSARLIQNSTKLVNALGNNKLKPLGLSFSVNTEMTCHHLLPHFQVLNTFS